MSKTNRVVITGMAINTPLGDTLEGFLGALLAGRSALSRWKTIDTSRIYSKVGADLSDYDVAAKVASFEGRVPDHLHRRLRKLVAKSPWSTRLTMLMSLAGYLDAGLANADLDPSR